MLGALMRLCSGIIAALLTLAWPGCAVVGVRAAAAHPVLAASAVATVSRGGSVEVSVRHDALAFALGEPPRTIDDKRLGVLMDGPRADLELALGRGRERFGAEFELTVDGTPVPARIVSSPTAEQIAAWKAARASPVLPVMLEFVVRADLPRGSTRLAMKFPDALGDVVLTVQTPGREPLAALVRGGDRSDEYAYDLSAPVIPGTTPPGASGAPGVGSAGSALNFLRMGFDHIVSWNGRDHMLFVLGLFFLSPRVKPLLVQITGFTLAHSVTLALCARGVISLPDSVVEPAIAASIAFVAIENIFTNKVHAWRLLIVFGFGLVHGLGFAASFAAAVKGEHGPLGPVLLFNAGVEAGQLAIVGAALLTVGWFRGTSWYRPGLAIPASAFIACAGLWWTAARMLGG
jgi:hypothetical protein